MPLLFILAGVSTKFALQKRSYKEYLLERVKRLLIPFFFGVIVLMPVMAYLADRFNYSYSGGFVEHYAIFFTKYTDLIGADGGFSLGQLWFCLYLELLAIGGKSFVEYMYLFILGYYVFADEKIINKAEKNCWLLFGIGLVATILNTYLFIWSDKEFVLLNTVTKYVSEWIMIIALIGLAKRYLNFSGKVSSYMNKRSFLFYIYHFIWVVLIHGIVRNHTFILFMGTVLLAYGATFICCEISIRIPFMCFHTGIKYSSKK